VDPVLKFLRRHNGSASTAEVAKHLKISRQAAHRKLRALANDGAVVTRGGGRTSRWELASQERTFRFAIRALAEDRVWAEIVRTVPAVTRLSAEATSIASYAFTEMLNNAVDHSGSKTVDVRVRSKRGSVEFEIVDRGVGAFESVREKFGLATELEALGEISKGKTTTMPERHSGEGIFFTSKAVRRFELDANGTIWIVEPERGEMAVAPGTVRVGTRVRFEVAQTPARTLRSLFDEYSPDLAFSRTRTVVRLFAHGTQFVSRSEARRMLVGLERFREVVLDFDRVVAIGQGFADEVFRVWSRAHQDTALTVENASEEVRFMIERAKRSP
jgi:anti-sigma regulatory factor (Ser/Thr protein kinase)